MRILKYMLLLFFSMNLWAANIKDIPYNIDYYNVIDSSSGQDYQCAYKKVFSANSSSYEIGHLSENLDFSSIIPSSNGSPIYISMPNKKTVTFEYPYPSTSHFTFKDRLKDDLFEFICIMKNNSNLACINESNSTYKDIYQDKKYNNSKDGIVIIYIDSNFKIDKFSFNFDTETIDYTVRERRTGEKPETYSILRIPYGYKKNFIIHEQ